MDPVHGLTGALRALVFLGLLSVVTGKDPYLDFTCVASQALIPIATSTERILIEAYTPVKNATFEINGKTGSSTRTNKVGAYVCSLETENQEATTTVIVSSEDASLYPPRLTVTFNPDEEINLQMLLREDCGESCLYRWRDLADADGIGSNEEQLQINGFNETSVVFRNFLVGSRQKKGLVQVLVRECPSGYWNPVENCMLECSICLNGGMCHPRSGQCICPPGFSGVECQNVHGRNIFGQEGQYNCSASSNPHDNGCIGKLFCLPEPFGCTCAAGYRGINCSEGCKEGMYGANCEGVCHCEDNSTCLADTGECVGSSCQEGWLGINCQVQGPMLYKELKEVNINQTTNITCILKNVKDPNDTDIVLILPNGVTIEADYFIEYQTPVMAEYIFVVVADARDNEYTCAYKNITLQDTVNRTDFVRAPMLYEELKEVNINQTTNITCILKNVKNPNDTDIVLILPNGTTIEADYTIESEISIQTEYIFVIVADAKANEYTCTNDNATVQKTFNLTAYEPPYLSNPPTINSSNVNEITITWNPWGTQPGDRGDPPVMNYIITYKDANVNDTTTAIVTQGNTTSYTVVGLMEDTEYDFRVTAVRPGVGGAGPPSPPAQGNTTCLVPGKLVSFIGVALNATSLQLSWFRPINTLCSLITYKITYWLVQQGECTKIIKGNFDKKQITTENQSLVIGDLLPYTLYIVTIKTNTSAGLSKPSLIDKRTPESVPGPPINVDVKIESSTLSVKWEAPNCADRNGAIIGYHYQLLISGGKIAGEGVTESNVTQRTFDNLLPCTEYGFRVRGWTSVGNGTFSQTLNETTPSAVPGKPVNFIGVALNATSLQLSWFRPINTLCSVITYNITYWLVQQGECTKIIKRNFDRKEITTENGSLVIGDLLPDTLYKVKIVAITSAGESSEEAKISKKTPESVPGPPRIGEPTIDSFTLKFNWEAPNCADRNGKIVGYHYQLLISGGKIVAEGVTESNVKQHIFDNLLPCTEYGFRVRGWTSVGNGTFSQIQNETTPSAVPDEVTDIHVSNNSSTTLHVSWSAPTEAPCPITGYTVTYTLLQHGQCEGPEDAENPSKKNVSETVTVLEMLHPDSVYMVVVRAKTDVGEGNGVNNTGRTLEDAPGRPVSTNNINSTTSSLTFSWDLPPCGLRHGIILGFFYQLMEKETEEVIVKSGATVANTTTAMLGGLEACTEYLFKVRAWTSAGNGSFSLPAVGITESIAPDAVGDLQTETQAASIHLNWTQPNDISCSIIRYKVTYKLIKVLQCLEEENAIIHEELVNHLNTQHTFFRLLPASKYEVSVTAETAGGLGERRTQEVVTNESVPGIPTAIINTVTSSRSVTFTWQPPTCRERNGTITWYTYKLVRTAEPAILTEERVSPDITSATFDGLTACTQYHFKVRAHTSVTFSPFSAAAYVTTDGEVPDVVSKVQALPTSDSIEVTWEPPTNVLCDITGYLISFKLLRYSQCSAAVLKSQEYSVIVGSTGRLTYTIQDLSAASGYYVSVRANTTSGLGDVVNINVSTLESAPESVTNVTLTDVGPFTVSFSWSPPACEDMHGRITLYSYHLALSDTEAIAGNTTEEVVSFGSLTPCTFYGFTVAAWNSAGMGPQSKPLNFTTNVTVPGQVAIPRKDSKNATAVRIQWLSPRSTENPCSIETYIVTYTLIEIKQCETTSKETFMKVTTGTKLLLVGLRPNSKYTVAVKASTLAGVGNHSDEKEVTTNLDAPGQITDVMVSNTTMDSIKFTWSELDCESQHGEIKGYKFEFKAVEMDNNDPDNEDDDDDVGEWETVDLFFVFNNLTSCTEYEFRVQAKRKNQIGIWSEWVRATTSTAAPEKVNNLVLQRGDPPSSIIDVTWQPSDLDSCTVNTYQVMYTGESLEACSPHRVFNSTSITVGAHQATLRNLWPYSRYNITVRGKNSAGIGKINTGVLQTAQDIPSAQPEDIVLVDRGPNHLKFTWQPPVCGQQNGLIVNYNYTLVYSINNETVKNNTVETTEAILGGLMPFVEYGFTVQANTKKGSGPLGHLVAKTAEGVPSAPRNFRAVKSETTRLELRWDAPDPPTGIITAYQLVYWHSGLDETSAVPVDYEVASTTRVLRYFLEGLKPYTDYYIKIRGKTGAGFGTWSKTIINRTAEGAPEQPTNVAVVDRTTTTLTIQWNSPENTNGVLKGYKIEYRIVDQPFAVSSTGSDPEEVNISSGSSSHTLEDLKAATGYEIKLAAMTVEYGVYSTLTPIYTQIPVIAKPKMLDAPSVGDDNMVTLQLEAIDSPYISVYQVTVAKVKSESTISRREVGDSSLGSYQQSQDEYITAEFNKTALPSKFQVGDNKTYNGYYNAPLDPGTNYGIQFCGVGKTKQDTNPSCTEPLAVKTRELGTGMEQIIAVIVGILVVMAIVVVVLAVIVRRRRQADKTENTNGITLSSLEKAKPRTNGVPNQSAVVEELVRKELTRTGGVKQKSTTPVPKSTKVSAPPKKAWKPHKLVSLQDLPEYIKKKKAKGNKGFSHDFASLPDEQLYSCDVAQKEEQRCKNRYANIIPYDCTRVLLDVIKDDQDTDYINASYIDGYQRKNAYIATQGPNKSSSPDFWRMVWEQEVMIVVMLTNLVENAKKKCIQYWPDEQQNYGDIVVKLVSEKVKKNFTERSFVISNINIDEDIPREIKQFHYTSWPDMGLPDSPAPLMKFIHEVKQNEDDNKPSPMVVHCSAGVGRTGTFITVDAMLNMVAEEKQINIIDFVYQMRKHRMKMVQTMDQYMFIFEVLVETLLCGETVMEAGTFPTQYTALHDRNPLTGNTYVEEHFRVLDTMSVAPSDDNCHGGRNEMNVNKNRFHDCIPLDKCRPYLMSPGEDDNSTNYINASFIDGYKKKDGFLATQSPLSNTVVDFWRMIYDYNARVIVMLNDIEGSEDETLQPYWLDDPEETAALGIFELQLRDCKDFNHTIARTFKLKNTNKISEKPRTIHHFEFKKWKEDEEFPESIAPFVCFLELVEQGQRQSGGDGRTAVHCLDGVTRSGIFCATMVALKKLKEEKVVDIFHAVRNLRRNRDVMVESQDHYLFCYEVLKMYLEENETYANFR